MHEVCLYPNPVTSTSKLTIKGLQQRSYSVDIYNIVGDYIKSFVVSNNELLLHRRDFVPGIYFYRLTASGSEIITGKFIVE